MPFYKNREVHKLIAHRILYSFCFFTYRKESLLSLPVERVLFCRPSKRVLFSVLQNIPSYGSPVPSLERLLFVCHFIIREPIVEACFPKQQFKPIKTRRIFSLSALTYHNTAYFLLMTCTALLSKEQKFNITF